MHYWGFIRCLAFNFFSLATLAQMIPNIADYWNFTSMSLLQQQMDASEMFTHLRVCILAHMFTVLFVSYARF